MQNVKMTNNVVCSSSLFNGYKNGSETKSYVTSKLYENQNPKVLTFQDTINVIFLFHSKQQ